MVAVGCAQFNLYNQWTVDFWLEYASDLYCADLMCWLSNVASVPPCRVCERRKNDIVMKSAKFRWISHGPHIQQFIVVCSRWQNTRHLHEKKVGPSRFEYRAATHYFRVYRVFYQQMRDSRNRVTQIVSSVWLGQARSVISYLRHRKSRPQNKCLAY